MAATVTSPLQPCLVKLCFPSSRIGAWGRISVLCRCFNQGFSVEGAYKRGGVHLSSCFGSFLSPAKSMIISYHDQVFQEPGLGTRTLIYQPMMDLQSSQSLIYIRIKDQDQSFSYIQVVVPGYLLPVSFLLQIGMITKDTLDFSSALTQTLSDHQPNRHCRTSYYITTLNKLPPSTRWKAFEDASSLKFHTKNCSSTSLYRPEDERTNRHAPLSPA
jgi:hypothetical protein